MSGKWSGGSVNRTWGHPGSRAVLADDADRGARLWPLVASEIFWCETCGGAHPLRETPELPARPAEEQAVLAVLIVWNLFLTVAVLMPHTHELRSLRGRDDDH